MRDGLWLFFVCGLVFVCGLWLFIVCGLVAPAQCALFIIYCCVLVCSSGFWFARQIALFIFWKMSAERQVCLLYSNYLAV